VPSATGGANGGVGFGSDSSLKNIYARLSYRFNLERNSESRSGVQAAGPTGPRDHTFLAFGSFYVHGNSLQRLNGALADGTAALLTAHEPFYRAGGDFNFNYRNFNLYGLYMLGRDNNLLPVDAKGNFIPLPVDPAGTLPVGFVASVPAKFNGGFAQADYLALPWLMAIMRWDGVHSSADRINGLALSTATPFFAPLNSTRNRFTPGVQFLIRANIKLAFEYQIRPMQFSTVVTDPITGSLTAAHPFRVNTAVLGLEFVY
jgi:hypothetical protein